MKLSKNKQLFTEIFKLILPMFVFGIIFFLFNIGEVPISNWRTDDAASLRKIIIGPHYFHEKYRTINHSFEVTDSTIFHIWIKAVNDGLEWEHLPSKWKEANRNCGLKTIQMKFEYMDGSRVSFEIWFCNKYGIISYQELYEGDSEFYSPFRTKYSKKLKDLINAVFSNRKNIWIDADPKLKQAEKL